MIVAVVGKNGKTTISSNLAAALAEMGREVEGLDSDIQGSWREWDAQRTKPAQYRVRKYLEPNLIRDLPGLMAGVDDLIIDLPAGTGRPGQEADLRTRIIRNAILAALSEDRGAVLGVIIPSPYEVWASDDLVEVLEQAWTHPSAAPRARQRTALLMNQAGTTRRGGQGRPDRVPVMVRAVERRLESSPVPLLKTRVHRSEASFMAAAAVGLAVTEYAPKSKSASEIRSLAKELLILTGEKKR